MKKRYHGFIVYPSSEGLPNDWVKRLEDIGDPIAISPLHDKDLKTKKNATDPDELVKPHHHCIYINSRGPVASDSIRKKLERAGVKVKHVEIIDDLEGAFKYLTHESKSAVRAGKHKYDSKDTQLLNHFDISRYVKLTEFEKDDLYNNIVSAIIDNSLMNIIQVENFFDNELLERLGYTLHEFRQCLRVNSFALKNYYDGVYQEDLRKLAEKDGTIKAKQDNTKFINNLTKKDGSPIIEFNNTAIDEALKIFDNSDKR